jgi:hypothetical protein
MIFETNCSIVVDNNVQVYLFVTQDIKNIASQYGFELKPGIMRLHDCAVDDKLVKKNTKLEALVSIEPVIISTSGGQKLIFRSTDQCVQIL